jgi:hypothetical protein
MTIRVNCLLWGKIRPPRIPPLGTEVAEPVVALSLSVGLARQSGVRTVHDWLCGR